ncbi:MAG TPA: CPBP family intramembrane glutamic endopeptidase [Thermoanaerobaculia bacterium]|jgi:membrane protease YdiL (CAAX protease family)|nr:CPBP family intramembrane glutamic endopeptidase [Thermoanaerobaculia bacterium]
MSNGTTSSPSSTAASPRSNGAPEPLASRRHTIRLLLIVSAIAVAGLLRAHTPGAGGPVVPPPGSRVPLYLSVIGLQLGFVWFISLGLRARGHRVVDLIGRGWRSPLDGLRDGGLAVLFLLVLHGCSLALRALLGPSPTDAAFLLPLGALETLLWVAVAITAGVCEEIVFRGYLQPQLWALSGKLPLAIVLQALVFGLAHLYQGWRPALVTVVYGLAFGALAAWRRSIVPGAIAHSLIDVIGGLWPH